jgi:hypothetical protein
LRYAPNGWEKGKFQIIRNEKYRGLTRKLSINELTFVKDGRDFIRDVYEAQGINAVIMFTVMRLDDTDQLYDTYFTGMIDLATYAISETGVKIQVIDNSFTEKIKNRENTKVNIRQNYSVGGFETTDISNVTNDNVRFAAVNIMALATWKVNSPDTSSDTDHYIPIELVNTEFTEAQSQTVAATDPMFVASLEDRILRVSGSIEGLLICNELAATASITIRLFVNAIAVATLLTENDKDVYDLPFAGTFDESFSIVTGDTVSIQASVGGAVADPDTVYYVCDIALTEVFETLDQVTLKAYPFYESLLKVTQLIGDKDDSLKSTYFGRTDTPIVTYANDGQLGHITRGLFLRRAYGMNDTLSLSLQELFESLSKIFCLGMAVETVSGTDKVVIEELSYFFDNNVIIDLSNRVREATIEKEVLPTWHYNRVKAGFNSFEYLAVGGLSEFNTSSEWSTVITAVDNELDLIGRYRADTRGINLLRKAGPTGSDSKGDEDIYLIDTVRDTPNGFLARTDEGFTLAVGGVDAGQSYNLDFSPARTLRRWGRVIRAGMEHNLNSLLRWQASDKNSTLETQKSTETSPIDEDGDILVNDLSTPYWYPEAYSVECEMLYSEISAILNNPKGLIKLASGKYGWILEFSIGMKENKATMKLLRCNTNYVTPVEI